MFKSLRVPEKLFQLSMWLVSLVFAGFLVGLGSKVVADLPRLETQLEVDQFADTSLPGVRAAIKALDQVITQLGDEREQAQLAARTASNAYSSARSAFDNWLSTRRATSDPAQDPEVVSRTRQLDVLKTRQREADVAIERVDQRLLDARQELARRHAADAQIMKVAQSAYETALFKQEMRIFGARLAVTLPLIAIAGWLVVRKRRSDYWPLMRGFVLFALFTFFFELVPYLPSYGGYVRYIVGIVLTLVVGHYVIKSMRAYLAKRQLVEQQSQEQRRQALSYEDALKKMAVSVCPGCERALLTTGDAPCNFCVHCGMTLYVNCSNCTTRRNAFFHFCPACGTTADNLSAPVPMHSNNA